MKRLTALSAAIGTAAICVLLTAPAKAEERRGDVPVATQASPSPQASRDGTGAPTYLVRDYDGRYRAWNRGYYGSPRYRYGYYGYRPYYYGYYPSYTPYYAYPYYGYSPYYSYYPPYFSYRGPGFYFGIR